MYCNCILNNVLFREIATVTTQVIQILLHFQHKTSGSESIFLMPMYYFILMYAVNVFTSNK